MIDALKPTWSRPARPPSPGRSHRLASIAGLAMVCLWALGAQAHFLLNINIRVAHVEHLPDGLRLFLRVPMPMLVADKLGPELADGTRVPAPYTYNVIEDGRLAHYLDVESLRTDPVGLGRIVAEGHYLLIDGEAVEPRIEAVRAHSSLMQPLFSNLEQVRAALRGPPYDEDDVVTYVGDTVVDVALFYPAEGPVTDYAFGSTLKPGIEGQEELANLLLDHRGGDTQVFRARGLLQEPIRVSHSPLDAALTFVQEGIRHILEGYDHVLFVLCLTVGAAALRNLVWRVTGFTLGHTVTLIGGFLGFAPQGAWFIPAVETAIALSIIYAGVVALLRRQQGATFVITALIGLLHGFGFSFVLREVLRIDSSNLWVSLVSFNVGVEVGQLAIVAVVWLVLALVTRSSERAAGFGRNAVSLAAIGIAALWTGERVMGLLQLALG
ncbi:MAG: HupE/UreJ family protein [Kiloniellaceae bacterium]